MHAIRFSPRATARPVVVVFALVVMVYLAMAGSARAGGFKPDVAWKEAREAFSSPAEPFTLEVDWKVEKGFGERLDVEINGGKTASHYLPDKAVSGTVPLRFDGKKLGPGEHTIRVRVWQGEDKHRMARGETKPLRVLIVEPSKLKVP